MQLLAAARDALGNFSVAQRLLASLSATDTIASHELLTNSECLGRKFILKKIHVVKQPPNIHHWRDNIGDADTFHLPWAVRSLRCSMTGAYLNKLFVVMPLF